MWLEEGNNDPLQNGCITKFPKIFEIQKRKYSVDSSTEVGKLILFNKYIELFNILSGVLNKSNIFDLNSEIIYEEFDPGSGLTLAVCIIHASRLHLDAGQTGE